MPRVIGIDPGTVSIDVCGLDGGRVVLDESYPTRDALADPSQFVAMLESHAPLDLVAGPSGYGLPVRRARDLTEDDIRLAYLAFDGDTLIATAMLAADSEMERAEVAISIREDYKNRGLGWTLLDHVAHAAAAKGIKFLESIESRDNVEAIALEKEMGFTATAYPGDATLVLVQKKLG